MKIVRANNGDFKTVDFPYLIGAVAFPLSLFMLYLLAVRLSHGAQWREWLFILLGVIVAGAGGAFLTTLSTFEFDLSRRQVTWRRRGIFGATGGIVPFEKIKYAVVQYNEGTDSKGGGGGNYRVALCTHTETLPLTLSYSQGKINDDKFQQIRTEINKALGVHLPSESDNDILELVRANAMLWACKLAQRRQGFGAFGSAKAQHYVDGLAHQLK